MNRVSILLLILLLFIPALQSEGIEDLFKTASLWQVGDNKTKVDDARNTLAAMGSESLQWIWNNIASGKISSLQWRAVVSIFQGNDDAASFIKDKFASDRDNDVYLRILISLSVKLKLNDNIDLIKEQLKNKDLAFTAFSALVGLGYTPTERELIEVLALDTEHKKGISMLSSCGKTPKLKLLMICINEYKVEDYPLLYWAAVNSLKKFSVKMLINEKVPQKMIVDTFFLSEERSPRLIEFFEELRNSKNSNIRIKARIYTISLVLD
ncbi:hypothetical protein KAI78_01575 [bacterium]|nr:hypothetical protein [bacterium]